MNQSQAEQTVVDLEQRSDGGEPNSDICADICRAKELICPYYPDLCERLKKLESKHNCDCGTP